jgi:hypothetical protein
MKKIKKIELVLTEINPEILPLGYHYIVIPLNISQLKKIIDNEIVEIFGEYFDNLRISFIDTITGKEEEWVITEDLAKDKKIIKEFKNLINILKQGDE